jgi:NhaA family Na+:H+ antiporter
MTISEFSPLKPIQEFFKTESSSGIILLISTIFALLIANSPLADDYFALFQSHISVGAFGLEIDKPFILWINDGLMAIFFLLIGLEIKRELLYGELSDFKAAALPIVAAFGGALVPGLIFFGFNQGTEFVDGWAIAIATDIAFAIGILTLIGSRVPTWAKVFLTAVAVVDDLIAVLVIALFYTSSIKMVALVVAGGCLILLITLNAFNVNKVGLYLLIGVVMWVAFLKSGVHATIAGVLLGLTIPARQPRNFVFFSEKIDAAAKLFKHSILHQEEESRATALHYLGEVVEETEPPLYRLEHSLHSWVAYGIIPIFAFANAGVTLNTEMITEALSSPLTWGIILGLFAGKQIGIFLSVSIMRAIGLSTLPEEKNTNKILYGLACLSGVGFTMSLFIAGLSFVDPTYLEYTKVGIIAGSFLSGLLGYALIRSAVQPTNSA